MRQLTLSTVACAAFLTVSTAVDARDSTDWSYCIAPAGAEHIVYLSLAFETNLALDDVESAFARTLDGAHVRHDAVQCPRGDAGFIQSMWQHAIQFNHQAGNRVTEISWTP